MHNGDRAIVVGIDSLVERNHALALGGTNFQQPPAPWKVANSEQSLHSACTSPRTK